MAPLFSVFRANGGHVVECDDCCSKTLLPWTIFELGDDRMSLQAVTIQWTGLLDWTTGLDYWTHGNCFWRRKEQEYTEIHTAIQESRVIFHRSQRVLLNSVRSWCKCGIKNWSRNPGNEAKYSLEPKLSVPKTKPGTETDYNLRRAAGSTFGVHHEKKQRERRGLQLGQMKNTQSLWNTASHTNSAHAHLLAWGRGVATPRFPSRYNNKKKELSGWAPKTKLPSSVQLQHCYKLCGRVS